MKNFLKISAVCAVLIAVAWLAVSLNSAHSVDASSFSVAPAINAATTSAAFSITTSARILASTTPSVPGGQGYTRSYASICNANANPVWLNLDSDKPANSNSGNVTAVIAAAAGYNVCYEVTDAKLIYTGSITASSTNQTATVVTVKDYVY